MNKQVEINESLPYKFSGHLLFEKSGQGVGEYSFLS